jgi:hypothetical protein
MGVGRTLVTGAVDCSEAVALAGVAEVSPEEEQAVKMNSPINRILGVFSTGSLECQSNINTYEWPIPFLYI